MHRIPRVIHYCWFGMGEKSPLALACIESWKKFLPDYEIIEWNETNFDVNSNRYAREAYESKKWAFVSDFARFKIVYEYGGVYFDTDVEVLKPIEKFLSNKVYFGFQNGTQVNPGLGFGAVKENALIKELLDAYESRSFILEDGTLDYTTIVSITGDILIKKGLLCNNQFQELGDGVVIYPKDYFCPSSWASSITEFTENTHTIHHFDGSWFDEGWERCRSLHLKYEKYFGSRMAWIFAEAIAGYEKHGILEFTKRSMKRFSTCITKRISHSD